MKTFFEHLDGSSCREITKKQLNKGHRIMTWRFDDYLLFFSNGEYINTSGENWNEEGTNSNEVRENLLFGDC